MTKKQWFLTVALPQQPPRRVPLEDAPVRLGRAPDNDVVLEARSVSRYHAILRPEADGWVYEDLGSRNGSYFEGEAVQQVMLHAGQTVQLGRNPATSARLTLTEAGDSPPLPEAFAPEEDEGLVTGMESFSSFRAGQRRALIIGRSVTADIRLEAPVVSRRHARLLPLEGGEWALEDLHSTNGTFVNGERLRGRVVLRLGDVVQIGPFQLVYRGEGELEAFKAARGLRLDGVNLRWSAGKRRILHDISISCEPQEFVALVGGSGAGKSTLMRTLSGYLPPQQGKVLLAGDDLYRHFDAYRAQLGYVPQDDILHADLSVRQALWYAAKLRLPPDLSNEEIEERIRRVLEQVELTGQQDQPISSLSGGQRKRASIAGELLADPPVLFLDEPTSGLDPGLEKKMMYTLRKLADGGKTILLVTHATANIAVCDQVAFLSQGRLVYYGPPQEARDFFEVEEFADIYDTISAPMPDEARRRAEAWRQRYEASPFYRRYVAERLERVRAFARRRAPTLPPSVGARKTGRPGIGRQFVYLTRRYFNLILRDRVLLAILLLIMPLLAGLIMVIAKPEWLVGNTAAEIEQHLAHKLASGAQSAIYSVAGKAQALLFMMALAAVLLGLFSSAYEIIKERHVYRRERTVFLSLIPYLASKMVLLGLFAALQAALFLVVISLKVHLPRKGVFLPAPLEMYGTLFLAAVAAIALGLLISAASPSSNTVVYVILGVLFFQILFAGTLFSLPGASSVISRFTLTRWATEALGVSVNIEELNGLSQSRFVPGKITQEVSVTVEKPAPDWEPVTVTSEMKEVPGCSQPVAMPVVKKNEMRTVEEEVTKEVTVEPDPITVDTPVDFEIDYHRTIGHLLLDWGVLVGFTVVFVALTLLTLRRQDVV